MANESDKDRDNNMEPRLGNTLDYYNDDISRKAVSGLVARGGEDKPSNSGNRNQADESGATMVKGFETQRHSSPPRYPADQTYPRLSVVSQEEGEPTRPSRAPASAHTEDGRSIDESDYAFGLYRKNRPPLSNHRPEPAQSKHEPPDTRKRPPSSDYETKLTPKTHSDEFAPPRPGRVYKKIEPEREFESQKLEAVPVKRRRADSPPKRSRTSVYKDADIDDDSTGYDDFERNPPSLRLIATSSAAFLGVLILSILVFQIISANNRLSEVSAEAERASELQIQLSEAQITIRDLENQLEDTQAELAFMNATVITQPTASPNNEEPVAAPSSQPVREHTVRPGDTLSSIAAHFYNDSSPASWQRILAANPDITPENIRVGQNLVIPH